MKGTPNAERRDPGRVRFILHPSSFILSVRSVALRPPLSRRLPFRFVRSRHREAYNLARRGPAESKDRKRDAKRRGRRKKGPAGPERVRPGYELLIVTP